MTGSTLALRALGVGDLAVAVPALRGLRRAFPGRPLVLAAPRWLAPLVDLVGGVDALVPLDGVRSTEDRDRHKWTVPPPALAVNLHGAGPQSHRLLQAARPARLLAFACPAAGHLHGPPWTDPDRDVEHESHRWCRLLAYAGIPADPADLAIDPPPPGAMPPGATVLHVGAKDPARRWAVDRFAEVARELAARGHAVALTGSADEAPAAVAVARAAGLPPAAVLAGATGLGDLAALVAHARLVVCGDTGVAHLATAFGTPSVVLFDAMDPAIWGPPPDRPRHRALWHPPHPTRPSGLAAIHPAEVLAAASAVANHRTPRRSRTSAPI